MKRGARPQPARAAGSERVYGLRAALAVCERRPGDVLEVAFTRDVAPELESLRARLKKHGATLLPSNEHELARIAKTAQHEGLCVVARPRRWSSPAELGELLLERRGLAIALDRVRNPHNIGAILRSAAFFGLEAVLLGAPAPHPGLDPMAVRVAEGGAEHLVPCRTTDLADTLGRLRARGVLVVGAEARASKSVFELGLRRPAILVVGHEREGLGARVRAQCDALCAIDGSGALDSLNVAVAAGVLMAEAARRAT
jgi:TrmH RNA methyltransferase